MSGSRRQAQEKIRLPQIFTALFAAFTLRMNQGLALRAAALFKPKGSFGAGTGTHQCKLLRLSQAVLRVFGKLRVYP